MVEALDIGVGGFGAFSLKSLSADDGEGGRPAMANLSHGGVILCASDPYLRSMNVVDFPFRGCASRPERSTKEGRG